MYGFREILEVLTSSRSSGSEQVWKTYAGYFDEATYPYQNSIKCVKSKLES